MAGKGRPTDIEIAAKRYTAKQYLDTLNSQEQWKKHIESDDPNVSLKAWMYLNDRVYGKPKQAVDLAGDLGIGIKRVVSDL